jgi:hypothetical protein
VQLVDRIEKRRFVGREFLLWLWFESEAFEATLSTKEHGTFGLWIEKHVILSAGKEATRIKGTYPARSREAKEALALGKLPEAAGVHLSLGDREITFTLKAERLALSGLTLPTVLKGGDGDESVSLAPRRPPAARGRKRATAERARESESDEKHESFYERMRLTREVEVLVEALYRDFLVLRLGATWKGAVEPALVQWVRGDTVPDAGRYRKARNAALSGLVRRKR